MIEALEQVLVAVASETGAGTSGAAGDFEFARGQKVFATASGNVADFRLDADIAEAALRTPSTTVSPRGGDWVRLAPEAPTPMDVDRARAWFLSAWRNAAS